MVARERGCNLNALVQQGVEAIVREEADREMYNAATLLGSDLAEADVEFFLPAMSEVVLRNCR